MLDSAVIQEWCRGLEGNERIPGTVSGKCRVCDDGAPGSMSIHWHCVSKNDNSVRSKLDYAHTI